MTRRGSRYALWVSTSTATRGGVASYVRTMQQTPLWERWSVRHVATHQDGSAAQRVRRFALALVVVLRLLVTDPPALVHLHTASRGSFARKSLVFWLARSRGVPAVVHVHGGGFGDFHDGSPAVLRRFIRATLERAEVVVALGESWATTLRRIAPDARVVVVPNAVAPVGQAPATPAGEPVHVAFLGQVSDDKGVPLLVRAWAEAMSGLAPGQDARLVVAGDGDLDGVRRLADELGVAGSVDLLGWVGPEEVDALLRRSEVLALPSRWEGHPMAVLEAMARGRAVVATRVGGLPDLVDDSTGVLVPVDEEGPLADALVRLLSDPELRARLGAGGLRRVTDELDVDVTWRTLDALYEEVVR